MKQNKQGIGVLELCREHGMSSTQFYQWRSKFGGMDVSMMKHLKELENENRRLKKMYAEENSKVKVTWEAIEKSVQAIPSQGDGTQSLRTLQDQYQAGVFSVWYQ